MIIGKNMWVHTQSVA